jgi:hypothetical protein
MELEILKQLSGTSSPMLIAAAILYFARQLKTSIAQLESSVEDMKRSMSELNLTITRLIVERDSDRKEIEAIKLDLRDLHGKG